MNYYNDWLRENLAFIINKIYYNILILKLIEMKKIYVEGDIIVE